MPAFGKAPLAVPGIGPLMPHNEQTVDRHRQRERSRSTARPRPKSIRDFSRSRSVFIYNVGPFPASIDGASLGHQYIPALDIKLVERVLSGEDYFVAGPLVIEGNPAESYPAEGGAKWIEHDPAEFVGYADHPGMHLALTMLGAGPQQSQDEVDAQGLPIVNLTKQGFFVSPIPAWVGSTMKPSEPNSEARSGETEIYQARMEDYRWREALYQQRPELLDQWKGHVTEAKERFIEWGGLKCHIATEAYKNSVYGMIRDNGLYPVLARLLKKDAIECPFLGTSADNSARRACRECGSSMQTDKPRCPACKALQMSPKAYKKWLADHDTDGDE